MSSRNVYLSEDERRVAPRLAAALDAMVIAFQQGQTGGRELEQLGRRQLEATPLEVQYLEIRDTRTLERVENVLKGATVFAAAFLGRTRLIDNRQF
jgi:pantoate--beta-alanine ligase